MSSYPPRTILDDVDTDTEIVIESCPVCGGITEHDVGCHEMDRPR